MTDQWTSIFSRPWNGRGRTRTSAVSRRWKTKDSDEIAKYIWWAGCRKGENRHVRVEQPQLGQLLIIGTRRIRGRRRIRLLGTRPSLQQAKKRRTDSRDPALKHSGLHRRRCVLPVGRISICFVRISGLGHANDRSVAPSFFAATIVARIESNFLLFPILSGCRTMNINRSSQGG